MFIDLFINLCMLISIIFLYLQFRWKLQIDKMPPLKSALLDGAAGGVLGFILMYFSIQVTSETLMDLRYIPIMLMIMFLGMYPALISSVLIIVSRFMFGINASSYAAIILTSLVFIGFSIINKVSKADRNYYRQSIYMILYSNLVFTIIISFLIKDWHLLKIIIPVYWIISLVGGLTSVFLVVYLRRSQYLLMKYKEESTLDFLTGLNNVRQFDHIWNALVQNAKEKNERLSLLMIDIDYFKKVNDTFGHLVGDKILIELGLLLKQTTRSFDIVSRNGGEEFSVILPDCPSQQAEEIAERVRNAVERHEFPISEDEKIKITVSIGVATYPEVVSDTEQIREKADNCLYTAKRLGRNQVCAEY